MANSMAQTSSAPLMRPRANTISHIDLGSMQNHASRSQNGMPPIYGHHSSASIGTHQGYGSLAMPGYHPSYAASMPSSATLPTSTSMHTPTQQVFSHSLRIETSGLGLDIGGGLRTAPVFTNPAYEAFFGPASSTINPAHLHFGTSESGPPQSPFTSNFGPYSAGLETDAHFDWTAMDENFLTNNNDSAIDQSSPSAISQNSAFSDMMIDGSNNPNAPITSGAMWTGPTGGIVVPANFMNDPVSEAMFPELMTHMGMSSGGVTSGDLNGHADLESYMSLNGHISMSPVPGTSSHLMQPPLTFGPDTANSSNSTSYGHSQLGSIAPMLTDSITDATRHALIFNLSQESSGYSHTTRRFSQSSIGSPDSPSLGASQPQISLPGTAELRRYVIAYTRYFHPHMPFLHLPTLNFDTLVFTNPTAHNPSPIGGGGCLLLAMASIGAFYEYEHDHAKQLFNHAKTLIKVYLDNVQRRSPSMMRTNPHSNQGPRKTPLWLVQAMLLNIILGHQSGDRVSAEIATTSCASLVSLAKDAQLDQPSATLAEEENIAWSLHNTGSTNGDSPAPALKKTPDTHQDFSVWYKWKCAEEQRRTLFSVFTMSNMLMLAYNQQPRILTSELQVDLPCEENLWTAHTATAWKIHGGERTSKIPFQDALSYLLNASRRTGNRRASNQTSRSELRPSSFGCYVLINALHLTIWEAQSRFGGPDKAQAAERLRNQIEPALREWQTAWRSNPTHILERPNPHGPMPADCIPLLDLAYVRLFVNLGRSKEALWIWDFDSMARELASESSADTASTHIYNPSLQNWSFEDDDDTSLAYGNHPQPSEPTVEEKKEVERLLRKAAFYAADSLVMSSQMSATLNEYTSRELPIGAAMCAFDCAQVLAEWIANVQDRLGKRIRAIIGRDQIDLSRNPAFLELEEEDLILLGKIKEILMLAGSKISADLRSKGQNPEEVLAPMETGGCGFSLLMVAAYMLGRAPVWGIQKIMTEALRQHANKLKERAETSIAVTADANTMNEFVMSNF